VVTDGVANVPYATNSVPGVVKVVNGLTIGSDGNLSTQRANDSQIKAGTQAYNPIDPAHQHTSAFYGLAKAAGADEKDSTLPIGTYTETAKTAIRTMLGAASTNIVAVQDE